MTILSDVPTNDQPPPTSWVPPLACLTPPQVWPDMDDQRVCDIFVREYGRVGYSLCFVYGALRTREYPRDEAVCLALSRVTLAPPPEDRR